MIYCMSLSGMSSSSISLSSMSVSGKSALWIHEPATAHAAPWANPLDLSSYSSRHRGTLFSSLFLLELLHGSAFWSLSILASTICLPKRCLCKLTPLTRLVHSSNWLLTSSYSNWALLTVLLLGSTIVELGLFVVPVASSYSPAVACFLCKLQRLENSQKL